MRNRILRLTHLLAAVSVSFSAYAQQTVKGVVQDENGAPVAGAFILIQGTTTGVTSDNNGLFEIKASKGQTLEISCLGMVTETVTVTGPSVAVHMQTDAEVLEFLSPTLILGSMIAIAGSTTKLRRNPQA